MSQNELPRWMVLAIQTVTLMAVVTILMAIAIAIAIAALRLVI